MAPYQTYLSYITKRRDYLVTALNIARGLDKAGRMLLIRRNEESVGGLRANVTGVLKCVRRNRDATGSFAAAGNRYFPKRALKSTISRLTLTPN